MGSIPSSSFGTVSAVFALRPPRLFLPAIPLAVWVAGFSGAGGSNEIVTVLWGSDAMDADRVRFFAMLRANEIC